MQLTQTQAQLAFIPLVALTMSGLMSLFMSAFNFGLVDGFARLWLKNWALGFGVALPTALFVVPLIRTGLARVTIPSSSMPPPSSPQHGYEAVTRAPYKVG